MQVVHPMQKCPAEFVETFREVLENTNWDSSRVNTFICTRVVQCMINKDIILKTEVVQWISTVIDHHIIFIRWLEKRTGIRDIKDIGYINQCRKAWLEWLVSPEGHYVNE